MVFLIDLDGKFAFIYFHDIKYRLDPHVWVWCDPQRCMSTASQHATTVEDHLKRCVRRKAVQRGMSSRQIMSFCQSHSFASLFSNPFSLSYQQKPLLKAWGNESFVHASAIFFFFFFFGMFEGPVLGDLN